MPHPTSYFRTSLNSLRNPLVGLRLGLLSVLTAADTATVMLATVILTKLVCNSANAERTQVLFPKLPWTQKLQGVVADVEAAGAAHQPSGLLRSEGEICLQLVTAPTLPRCAAAQLISPRLQHEGPSVLLLKIASASHRVASSAMAPIAVQMNRYISSRRAHKYIKLDACKN